jgi:uncharacterized membrane protein (DUF485 family)
MDDYHTVTSCGKCAHGATPCAHLLHREKAKLKGHANYHCCMIQATSLDATVRSHVITSSPTSAVIPWEYLHNDPAFAALLARKARFIVPAVMFFIAYYFALPILAGYAPAFMERRILGHINVAYMFALSQFAMGWLLMGLYMRRARGFDAQAQALRIAASQKRGD